MARFPGYKRAPRTAVYVARKWRKRSDVVAGKRYIGWPKKWSSTVIVTMSRAPKLCEKQHCYDILAASLLNYLYFHNVKYSIVAVLRNLGPLLPTLHSALSFESICLIRLFSLPLDHRVALNSFYFFVASKYPIVLIFTCFQLQFYSFYLFYHIVYWALFISPVDVNYYTSYIKYLIGRIFNNNKKIKY